MQAFRLLFGGCVRHEHVVRAENAQADGYRKNHSTVKEASELAETLGVKNLVLYHTEDKSIESRKQAYTAEAKEYYHGNVFVPDDLDVIDLG